MGKTHRDRAARDDGALPFKTLSDRCEEFLTQLGRDIREGRGNPVEQMAAFVRSETARAANERHDQSSSVVCFFKTPKDREDFILAARLRGGVFPIKMP